MEFDEEKKRSENGKKSIIARTRKIVKSVPFFISILGDSRKKLIKKIKKIKDKEEVFLKEFSLGFLPSYLFLTYFSVSFWSTGKRNKCKHSYSRGKVMKEKR